jgi:hypothetical protein
LNFHFLTDVFLYADAELHEIPAAHLIGEAVLVVIRRIELVKGIPVTAPRILRPRGVVALDKDARRRGNLAKRFPQADIAGPCADGRWAKRTLLSIKLGVVVELFWKSALHVQADRDFIKMAAADRFWKTKVPGCKAPEDIRLEGGMGNDVLETSVDSKSCSRELRGVRSYCCRVERTSSRAGLPPLWTSAFHGARGVEV